MKDCTYQRTHCMLPVPFHDSLTDYRWCEHSCSQLMHNLYSRKEAQRSWPIQTPALPVPELLSGDSWKWDRKTSPQFHRFHRHCGKQDSCYIFLHSETNQPKQNRYWAADTSALLENLCCGIQDTVKLSVQVTVILSSHYREPNEENCSVVALLDTNLWWDKRSFKDASPHCQCREPKENS